MINYDIDSTFERMFQDILHTRVRTSGIVEVKLKNIQS